MVIENRKKKTKKSVAKVHGASNRRFMALAEMVHADVCKHYCSPDARIDAPNARKAAGKFKTRIDLRELCNQHFRKQFLINPTKHRYVVTVLTTIRGSGLTQRTDSYLIGAGSQKQIGCSGRSTGEGLIVYFNRRITKESKSRKP